jgi:hypothetical protein
LLGWIGQQPVKDIYVIVGQVATIFYFLFFIILIPVIGLFEALVIWWIEHRELEILIAQLRYQLLVDIYASLARRKS